MRNAVFAILALAWLATAGRAQTSWADKMFPEGTSHDFGSIPRGAQLFHRFKLTNIYAARLEITQVRTSCGCVTVTPSTRTLDSRQEAFVDVMMDARKFSGKKSVNIYLTVGPQYVSTATVQVSANSRADVVFNPGQVNFGVVPVGQTPSQTIDVEYAGVLDWRISEVVKHHAPLDVKLQELYRRPGQVGYRLAVSLKEEAPSGVFKQELFLKTNDPDSPLVPVLVEATIQRPLTVTPNSITLGSPKVGETVTRRVVVRGSRPFRITGIEGLGNDVTADLPTAAAGNHVVSLTVRPQQPGELRRELRLKTDLGSDAPLTVTIHGTVEP
jgi:Protein of unknown function (DUF1573)